MLVTKWFRVPLTSTVCSICFLQTCIFSLHKMLIDGLEWCGLLWIIVDYCDVFISCLDSHSDGTHSLQRIQVMECYIFPNLLWWRNKLIYILDDWGWVHFQQILISEWTIPLIQMTFVIQSIKPYFTRFLFLPGVNRDLVCSCLSRQ